MRIATFNVQNLRLREDAHGSHFDGARDATTPLAKLSAEDRALDRRDRALTARVIADADADLVALQEVFDQRTLDGFHEALLTPLGARYPHRICLPGNDGRRHVALMSRQPLDHIESHASLSYEALGMAPPAGEPASGPVFRRDCLAASCAGVRFYVVHFKAPADAASLAIMACEALAVRTLIEHRFADPSAAPWFIIGDVNANDVAGGDVLDVLTKEFAADLGAGLPPAERWTYFHDGRGSYARPDRILASPAAAPYCSAVTILRAAIARAAAANAGPHLPDTGYLRPRASDHALLSVDFVR